MTGVQTCALPISSYALFPEMMYEFIQNEALWAENNHSELLKKRAEVLERLMNKTKGLDFLRENR